MADDTPAERDRDHERRPSPAEAAAIAGGTDATPDVVDGGVSTGTEGDMSNASGVGDSDQAWQRYVPFEQPYRQQVDAIERALDVFADEGYLAMEGACGTGKTLIALVSAIHAIRDPAAVAAATDDANTETDAKDEATDSANADGSDRDPPDVERAVVATPVKQQLKQFVAELRAINHGLGEDTPTSEDTGIDAADDESATDDSASDDDTEADTPTDQPKPIDGIVLRGKADMLPYARENVGSFAEVSVRTAAEDTREITVALVHRESRVDLDWPTHLVEHCSTDGCYEHVQGFATCPEHGSETDDDGPWYDPVRAAAVAERAEELDGERLATAGIETPYPETLPHSTQVADDSDSPVPTDAQGLFDPFLAGTFAAQRHPPFGFGAGPGNVLDGETVVREAASAGVCPHESMASLLADAEVAIGNYAHLFDPDTRKLTADKAGVLDADTLAIVDEAHMIEERVREMLSTTCSLHALRIGRNDVRYALEYLRGERGDQGARREAQEALRASENVPEYDTFEEIVTFVEWLMDELDREVREDLAEAGGWEAAARERTQPEREIPLEDPESDERDRLFERSKAAFDAEIWKRVVGVGRATEVIHDGVGDIERTTTIGAVGEFAIRWANESRSGYFREITLEHSPKDRADETLPDWTAGFNAAYYLFNCIPSERLAGVFEDLAGGIVMSATLEPFAVFTEAVGLTSLAEDGESHRGGDGTDDTHGDTSNANTDEAAGRRVETVRYGLAFPRENRASWAVDAPAYTYRNRGAPTPERDRMTDTRRTYADVLADVATSAGNVLVCLPSYREAEWATQVLDRAPGVGREVLLDRSTDASATDTLLERFFEADDHDRVLVTSTRGTVTEGVDYAGERLHTCAVVGVPMVPPTPRTNAVVEAYDERLGEGASGFAMAVAVPAVRKARQAFGRVLRGPGEVGARVLVDGRYLEDDRRSVAEYLSTEERAEFARVPASGIGDALDLFWSDAARQ